MEVGTGFADGHVPSRYPRRYSAAFASSILLYPLPHQAASRLPCPIPGAATGLPGSISDNMTGIGAVC